MTPGRPVAKRLPPAPPLMRTLEKESTPRLPATPWGLLPPRMRVLYVAAPRRTGAWLAEAFANDSACNVTLEEAAGGAAGLAACANGRTTQCSSATSPTRSTRWHWSRDCRAGGTDEPLVVLGQASEQEMAALAYEIGADAYICANTATTRTLLWIVARATERSHLLRDNRRLAQAERHRKSREHDEAERLLVEQRDVVRGATAGAGNDDEMAVAETVASGASLAALGCRAAAAAGPPPGDALVNHYRELLRAHVVMGSGNLTTEMAALAERLAEAGVTAPQTLELHVQVLEELVHGLGSRSAAARDDPGRPVGAGNPRPPGRAPTAWPRPSIAERAVLPMSDERTTIEELKQLVAHFVAERDWGKFHTPKNLAMALAIEAAELMEHFQWLEQAESRAVADDAAKRGEVGEELADVIAYALAVASELGIDVAELRCATRCEKTPSSIQPTRFAAAGGGAP